MDHRGGNHGWSYRQLSTRRGSRRSWPTYRFVSAHLDENPVQGPATISQFITASVEEHRWKAALSFHRYLAPRQFARIQSWMSINSLLEISLNALFPLPRVEIQSSLASHGAGPYGTVFEAHARVQFPYHGRRQFATQFHARQHTVSTRFGTNTLLHSCRTNALDLSLEFAHA
jgi:hypothetical protein